MTVSENINPPVSWQLTADYNGARETAYEIEVYDLLTGKRIATTGKQASPYTSDEMGSGAGKGTADEMGNNDGMVHIDGMGSPARNAFTAFADVKAVSPMHRLPITSDGIYTWRVRVWNESGKASKWSSADTVIVQSAATAFQNAQWVGAVTKKQARIPEGRLCTDSVLRSKANKALWAATDPISKRSITLRKQFQIPTNKIIAAFVNVSGLGFCETAINGHKTGDYIMSPLWSDYDKSVFYNTYDIRPLLKENGENEITLTLGNGFYNEQGGRYVKFKGSFGPPTAKCRITIYYKEGGQIKQQIVTTGNDWEYSLNPITFNSIFGGEDYNACLEDSFVWKQAVVQESPSGMLRPVMAPPVRLMRRYGIKERLDAEIGMLFNMGQNIAGFPQITLKGKRGQKVKITVAERINNGKADQRQTGKPHYYEYTLKGEGEETWHPLFSYYSFQYIQVEGAVAEGDKNPDGLPVMTDLQSCLIHNSVPEIAEFECSNSLINQTRQLIQMAVKSNMQSVFTDCPAREKLGWLEQDYLCAAMLSYNYDLRGYWRQEMQNIADAQWENGGVPTTAPEYIYFVQYPMFRESPEWGGAIVYIPLFYYKWYGDDSLVRQYYDNMKRYVDYLASKANDGILKLGLGDWYDYGEGKAGFSKNTPLEMTGSAHYFLWTKLLSEAARLIGNDGDAKSYADKAEAIRKAINSTLYHSDTHQYASGSQAANAYALVMGIVEKSNEQAVLQNLLADIKAHGDRLTTGDISNLYLFTALSNYHKDELLYKMLNHYDAPGYGSQIKYGATTLTEQWDPQYGASWNHFMMGHIEQFHFSNLAGISFSGNECTFEPRFLDDLTYVKASTESAYGKIKVEWRRTGNAINYHISVPVNMKAKVILPGKESVSVESGEHDFSN